MTPPPVTLAPEPGPVLAGAAIDDAIPAGRRHVVKVTSLKPATYAVMHLVVAVTVAYALTRDWRIALGVGIIEPMVQTVAYILHEKAWAKAKPDPQRRDGAFS